MNQDEVFDKRSILGYNLYAYCQNNPIMHMDSTGNVPQWIYWGKSKIYDIGNSISGVWKNVTKTSEIILTEEFLFEELVPIIISNVEADAGISIGMGMEFEKYNISFEAISRMDIVGIQFKDGKVRLGHDGRSALTVGYNLINVGPQNDTFESFMLDYRESGEPKVFDIGISTGMANAFIIGYHYNASISFSGIFGDIVDYVKDNWH